MKRLPVSLVVLLIFGTLATPVASAGPVISDQPQPQMVMLSGGETAVWVPSSAQSSLCSAGNIWMSSTPSVGFRAGCVYAGWHTTMARVYQGSTHVVTVSGGKNMTTGGGWEFARSISFACWYSTSPRAFKVEAYIDGYFEGSIYVTRAVRCF